ncbi:hypothetical protein JCM4814A_09650 [Streptomyces phaeofaciens JCM 4814]|uniref:Luciferase-like domain-containing protein n=1 Tax=Streptomyces phaeofaciens TaxID=68254 RepID=A0A918LXH1_9ACTN|nr:hypothetical protein GCM10010226_52590 [Streptomyces phaeofaciens]
MTCPLVRTHPAVIAQAAETSAVQLGGRFRLGVGTGEALIEHILGTVWPEAPVRLEMLEEAHQIIRRLFTGERISHRGAHYTVKNARLYTLRKEPEPIDVSAFGPQDAEVAARIGHGLISMMPEESVVERFRCGGGGAKPVYGGLVVCWGSDEREVVRTAHRLRPTNSCPASSRRSC